MIDFEIVSHTADLEIKVYGKDQKELFKNALIGMFQSIRPKSPDCKIDQERLVCKNLPEKHEVKVNAPDLEQLLVDFLSEALYLSDFYNEAYLDADIFDLKNNYISAILKGIKIEGFEVVEIKAVTYSNLNIKNEDGYYTTNIVFDI